MAKKATKLAESSSEQEFAFKEWKRPRPKEVSKRSVFEPTLLSSIQNTMLKNKGLDEVRQKLFMLYEHWEMVLGDDLANLAYPIGHRNRIILIAAEDSMALSELSYATEEILDRIQAFMDEPYFEKVELHLLQSKQPLNQIPKVELDTYQVELIRPENLGNLNLPEGPVRDAYLHYLTLFEK